MSTKRAKSHERPEEVRPNVSQFVELVRGVPVFTGAAPASLQGIVLVLIDMRRLFFKDKDGDVLNTVAHYFSDEDRIHLGDVLDAAEVAGELLEAYYGSDGAMHAVCLVARKPSARSRRRVAGWRAALYNAQVQGARAKAGVDTVMMAMLAAHERDADIRAENLPDK